MRISVDRNACVGAGDCLKNAPGVFRLDAEQIAVVINPAAASDEELIEAARMCPSQAIRLWDDQGKKVYPDWLS
jgi:ferredoxin